MGLPTDVREAFWNSTPKDGTHKDKEQEPLRAWDRSFFARALGVWGGQAGRDFGGPSCSQVEY